MTSPNATFTEMVSTTLRNHSTMVSDNVSANNALYTYLKKKGKIVTKSGGYEIAVPLDYAENSTFQRYSGFDQLTVQASDVITSAKYDWCQSAVHIVSSGRELRMNSGKEAMINLAKAKVKNAMRTAANNMSVDLYSSGALTNQIGGLAHIIQAAGTGTVGGIDSSTYTFWQNKYREMSGTGTWSKSTIKGEMNALYMPLCRGVDKTDLIVSSHDLFAGYWESLQDLQRYTSDTSGAGAGFKSLKYVDADMIFDSNTNFGTTAEKMYFLNTEYLELVEHSEARWTQLDEKNSVNQDGVILPVIWMGQLTCSNRSLQGVLIDAA